jgi:hypothetical protein
LSFSWIAGTVLFHLCHHLERRYALSPASWCPPFHAPPFL